MSRTVFVNVTVSGDVSNPRDIHTALGSNCNGCGVVIQRPGGLVCKNSCNTVETVGRLTLYLSSEQS